MKVTSSRKQDWPRKVSLGRVSVTIYKRIAPNGSPCYMVANYASGKRRFDSYAGEAEAIEAANKLARQLSAGEVIAAKMTNTEASEYAAAVQRLAPFNVELLSAADTVAQCLKLVGDLPNLHAAAKFYQKRNKQTSAKRVADVVAELLTVKEARGASVRYLQDLKSRLNRFAESFQKNIGDVTTAEVQGWLDAQKKLSPQTHVNFRRVIHLLFKFATARGHCLDNPVDGVERVKVRNGGSIAVFTPKEIARLLAAASPDFMPSLAIGAFAGLRSAEIERLSWRDIDLKAGHIIVGADMAKTASRRIVPIAANLAEWLKPHAGQQGKVWKGGHDEFYERQQDTAKAAGLAWKANALRHSCASYMFALTNDAGRIAGFLGNSASVIHRHYRELVKPAVAQEYFNVKPSTAVKSDSPRQLAAAA